MTDMSRDMKKQKQKKQKKKKKNECAPSEDSDQTEHPPSLIRIFAGRSVGSSGPKLSSRGQR